MDHCANIKCDGTLFRHNPIAEQNNNHYISLYESGNLKPFYIKEHTAQLSRDKAASYQKLFVDKRIHALSSSTTFEMGVDVGSLETVFLRNVPPTPANYVQRAGRAGRSLNSAAFALTYSKLSSHDFTYYNKPENMVSGKISAPLFELENEKIIRRHINAVALSAFLKEYPEYYDGDNRSNFLNSGGYTLLKEYLSDKPDYLQKLLVDSIPQSNIYGINDWSWIDFFTGQEGILETAVNDYYNTIRDLEKERERTRRAGNDEDAARIRRKLREYRADKEKDKLSNGRPPASRSLIDFLVRNNVLPKYGFPVDTVSLYPVAYAQNSNNNLQMQRDLQYAVAEYAPGSEIVADGRIYTSRYIKRSSNRSKGMWEYAYHTICQNKDCKAENYLDLVDGKDVIKCGSCGHEIARRLLKETIEPRKGFIAEEESHPVRMSKPDRNYRTDEFYIGDPSRRVIDKQRYSIHDQIIRVESTANDSLVVRTQTKFKVCRLCGFATGHNEKYQLEHKTAYGKKCSYDKRSKQSTSRL